jgi:hypothetical protein
VLGPYFDARHLDKVMEDFLGRALGKLGAVEIDAHLEAAVRALSTPVGEHQVNLAMALRIESPYGKPLTNASVRSGAWPHAIKNTARIKSSTAIKTDVSAARTAIARVTPSLVLLFKAINHRPCHRESLARAPVSPRILTRGPCTALHANPW